MSVLIKCEWDAYIYIYMFTKHKKPFFKARLDTWKVKK